MSREKALGIALGNINPITGEVLADFSPQKTKVIRAKWMVISMPRGSFVRQTYIGKKSLYFSVNVFSAEH